MSGADERLEAFLIDDIHAAWVDDHSQEASSLSFLVAFSDMQKRLCMT